MNTKPIKNHNQIVRPFFTAFRDASASLSSERAETPLWLCEEATYFVTNKVYADGKGPTYSYTPEGLLSRRVWARGVATDYASVASGTNVFTYTRLPGTDFVTGYSCGPFRRAVTYEPQRDLVATVTNSFGDRLISAFDYVNDPAGRRISRRDTRENEVVENVFGYNLRSELTSAQMGTNTYEYAYDPIGNRIHTVEDGVRSDYTANELNQYTGIQTGSALKQLSYDDDGNTVSDGTGWTYVWNGENRMVLASNDTYRVTYEYDERGRMVRKTAIDENEKSVFRFIVWDDFNIAYEATIAQNENNQSFHLWGMDMSGAIQASGGIGGLLAVSRNDETYIPSCDANGNIYEYVSTNGTAVVRQAYDPFSQPSFTEGIAVQFLHWFSTKAIDFGLHIVEYEFRSYDYKVGRWLTRDPATEKDVGEGIDGHNPVLYVRNNPLMYIDPDGRFLATPAKLPIPPFAKIPIAIELLITAIESCALPQVEKANDRYFDAGDAFKHCWVSCRISKRCGGIIAELAGLGKEAYDRAKAFYCSQYPESDWCKNSEHGDFWDSIDDLKANQQCIGSESLLLGPIGGWIGSLFRDSCDTCCRCKVGYDSENVPTR